MEAKVLKSIIPNLFLIIALLINAAEAIIDPSKGKVIVVVTLVIVIGLSYSIIRHYREENREEDRDNAYWCSFAAFFAGFFCLLASFIIYYA